MAMMATSSAAAMLKDLKARVSGRAVALLSRDGLVLHAEMPPDVYVETFAIMGATLLGAAATALRGLDRSAPHRIVVEGADATMVVVACGPRNLLVAVVGRETDPGTAAEEVERFAGALSSE